MEKIELAARILLGRLKEVHGRGFWTEAPCTDLQQAAQELAQLIRPFPIIGDVKFSVNGMACNRANVEFETTLTYNDIVGLSGTRRPTAIHSITYFNSNPLDQGTIFLGTSKKIRVGSNYRFCCVVTDNA